MEHIERATKIVSTRSFMFPKDHNNLFLNDFQLYTLKRKQNNPNKILVGLTRNNNPKISPKSTAIFSSNFSKTLVVKNIRTEAREKV
tara:strand:- start:187 stop:447 length:261 start_codon:yes stop_codon:yes gene_type:complete